MSPKEREAVEALISKLEHSSTLEYGEKWWAEADVVRALLDAPQEAPRGELIGFDAFLIDEGCPTGGGPWHLTSIGGWPIGQFQTREDAERVAEMLRDVGRRLKP